MVVSEFGKKYDYLVIDSVNFAYRVFKTKNELPIRVSKKSIYKNSVCLFINEVESLRAKYLKSDGHIYLLFDNYFSKSDLRSMYMYADRKKLDESYKASRKKENKEFYNSLNFLRYYYLIGPEEYHTFRVDNLEADDLVEPLFTHLGIMQSEKTALMVSTDLDWTRYLAPNVDWLPHLNESPEDIHQLSNRLGFEVSLNSVLMYKAIFGDHSDNISGLLPLNNKNLKDFNALLESTSYPESLVIASRSIDASSKSSILKKIAEDEKAYLINLQLVSTIVCSPDIVKYHLTSGRDEKTLYTTIRKAIELDGPTEFTFGNIRRNRVS